ncbi:MAG: hypothetical protein QM820_47515 [Minicystis sp.]
MRDHAPAGVAQVRRRVPRPRVDEDAVLGQAHREQRRLHPDGLGVRRAARVHGPAAHEDERRRAVAEIPLRQLDAAERHGVQVRRRLLQARRGVARDDEQRIRVAVPFVEALDRRERRRVLARPRIGRRELHRQRLRAGPAPGVRLDPVAEPVDLQRVVPREGEAQPITGRLERAQHRAHRVAREIRAHQRRDGGREIGVRHPLGLQLPGIVERGLVIAHGVILPFDTAPLAGRVGILRESRVPAAARGVILLDRPSLSRAPFGGTRLISPPTKGPRPHA